MIRDQSLRTGTPETQSLRELVLEAGKLQNRKGYPGGLWESHSGTHLATYYDGPDPYSSHFEFWVTASKGDICIKCWQLTEFSENTHSQHAKYFHMIYGHITATPIVTGTLFKTVSISAPDCAEQISAAVEEQYQLLNTAAGENYLAWPG